MLTVVARCSKTCLDLNDLLLNLLMRYSIDLNDLLLDLLVRDSIDLSDLILDLLVEDTCLLLAASIRCELLHCCLDRLLLITLLPQFDVVVASIFRCTVPTIPGIGTALIPLCYTPDNPQIACDEIALRLIWRRG